MTEPPAPPDRPAEPYAVRPTTPDDVAAIHAFIRPFVAAGRLLERTMEELEPLTRQGFLAFTPSGPAGGRPRIVGFAALEIYSRKLAEVRSLAVAEAYRGRGVGRELVARCVGLARERGVLEVMAITSTDGFFRACGFDFTLPGEKKALFVHTGPGDPVVTPDG